MIEPGEYRNQRSGKVVRVDHIAETGQVMLRADGKLRAFGSMLAFATTYEPEGGWPDGFVDSLRPAERSAPPPSPAPSLREMADELAWLMQSVAEPEQPEPAPAPEPEHHFADLMLADETIDDAKARLSHRLKELRHYLIAPEIRVNEDGSLGLTPAEQAELQDLERRQTLGRWLEA